MLDAQPEAGGERRTALLFGSRRALRAGAPSASAFGVLLQCWQ